MATTTTNFGWDIPQSTDLVKDGATAIAALGQDIDTALVDLKGGTTGQILSKASNTDLDFTWAAASSGGDFKKITASTFTASSAVSTDNCFTSTYTNYRIIVNITSASTGAIQRFRYRASGADNTAASYNGINEYFGAALGRFTSTNATSVYMYDSATNGNIFVMDILAPQVAEKTWYTMAAMQGSGYSVFGAGFFDASTQFDGITFFPASGTITGSIAIYGYGK
jgi:hypothetical protein